MDCRRPAKWTIGFRRETCMCDAAAAATLTNIRMWVKRSMDWREVPKSYSSATPGWPQPRVPTGSASSNLHVVQTPPPLAQVWRKQETSGKWVELRKDVSVGSCLLDPNTVPASKSMNCWSELKTTSGNLRETERTARGKNVAGGVLSAYSARFNHWEWTVNSKEWEFSEWSALKLFVKRR